MRAMVARSCVANFVRADESNVAVTTRDAEVWSLD